MIKKVKGRYCLYTKDGSKKIACHDTLAECKAQERAIKAAKRKRQYSMQASSQDLKLAVVPMAVIPSVPSLTMKRDSNGKFVKIEQEHIDAFLSFDPKERDAYVYLNTDAAHNERGSTNKALIGKFINKTYKKVDPELGKEFCYGDVQLQQLYRDPDKQKEWEKDIIHAISKIGPFPERSIDMKYAPVGNGYKWILEGVGICGAARGAVHKLPAIDFDEVLKQNNMGLSLQLSLNENLENNEMDAKEIQKMIDDAIAKEKEESKKTLQLALTEQEEKLTKDFEKKEKKIREQVDATVKSANRRETELFLSSEKLKTKVPSIERENWKEIILSCQELEEVQVTMKTLQLSADGKTKEEKGVQLGLAEAIKQRLENLPDYIKLARTTDGDENETGKDNIDHSEKKLFDEATLTLSVRGDDVDEQRYNLIRDCAKELNLNLADRAKYAEYLAKAEEKAIEYAQKSKNAKDLFGGELQ